jgi:hypothetical protein
MAPSQSKTKTYKNLQSKLIKMAENRVSNTFLACKSAHELVSLKQYQIVTTQSERFIRLRTSLEEV